MPEPFGWFSGSPPSTENMPRWTARRCECAGPFVLSHLHPTPVGIIQEVPVTETIYTPVSYTHLTLPTIYSV